MLLNGHTEQDGRVVFKADFYFLKRKFELLQS